jgi:hypothetical protein
MEDKVGGVVPSEKEIAKLVDEVRALQDKVARFTVNLSLDERKSTLKFRPGGERIVMLMSQLAHEHGVQLPGISVDAMKADLTLGERIAPLAQAVDALAQTLADTVLEAQSECWWAATAFYSALARLTSGSAKLQAALQPAVDFFAIGRRRVRAAAAPPSSSTPANH